MMVSKLKVVDNEERLFLRLATDLSVNSLFFVLLLLPPSSSSSSLIIHHPVGRFI